MIETKKLGAVSFLTKPSKLHDLKNAISLVLAKNWKELNEVVLVK
jgi:FixJ family two-component response regulator